MSGPCRHYDSLYGRCTACGMTWEQQAGKGAAPEVNDEYWQVDPAEPMNGIPYDAIYHEGGDACSNGEAVRPPGAPCRVVCTCGAMYERGML